MNQLERKSITCRAPTRVDLAGGTLDIWPLAPLLQARDPQLWATPVLTVNTAIDLWAQVELQIVPSAKPVWEFFDLDTGGRAAQEHLDTLPSGFALLGAAARYWHSETLKSGPSRVTLKSRTQAPRGSGLGGSSSLLVAALYAFRQILGTSIDIQKLALAGQNLEAGLLGGLAGNQDHLAAACGGVSQVEHSAKGSEAHRVPVDLGWLNDHLVLAHSGQGHLSVFSNWQILERALTGKADTLDRLAAIAHVAQKLPQVLKEKDSLALGKLLQEEWSHRRLLADGITTPVLDHLHEAACQAGAIGGKVCGAGGGGVLVMVVDSPQKKAVVQSALQKAGGFLLEAAPTSLGAHALEMESP